MNAVSLPLGRVSLCTLMCLAASCAMPPRDAWNIVQKHGLIPYMTGGYPTSTADNRYLASSAPFQTHAQAHVPYRAEREVEVDRDRNRDVAPPYRPRVERTVAEESPRSKPAPERILPKPRSENVPSHENVHTTASPKVSLDVLPYGTPVAGRPGMVMSPYAKKEQLVDVSGMAAGDPVKCPYSGKLFRVPPTQQASAGKAIDVITVPPSTPSPEAAAPTSPAPAPTTPAEDAKPKP